MTCGNGALDDLHPGQFADKPTRKPGLSVQSDHARDRGPADRGPVRKRLGRPGAADIPVKGDDRDSAVVRQRSISSAARCAAAMASGLPVRANLDGGVGELDDVLVPVLGGASQGVLHVWSGFPARLLLPADRGAGWAGRRRRSGRRAQPSGSASSLAVPAPKQWKPSASRCVPRSTLKARPATRGAGRCPRSARSFRDRRGSYLCLRRRRGDRRRARAWRGFRRHAEQ